MGWRLGHWAAPEQQPPFFFITSDDNPDHSATPRTQPMGTEASGFPIAREMGNGALLVDEKSALKVFMNVAV